MYFAIASAPSYARLPPIKPPVCTKVQPGILATSTSAWSRSPRQRSGRERRLSNCDPSLVTACHRPRSCAQLRLYVVRHMLRTRFHTSDTRICIRRQAYTNTYHILKLPIQAGPWRRPANLPQRRHQRCGANGHCRPQIHGSGRGGDGLDRRCGASDSRGPASARGRDHPNPRPNDWRGPPPGQGSPFTRVPPSITVARKILSPC